MSPLSRLQRLRARRTGRVALASAALAATAAIVGLLGGFASLAAGEPVSLIVRFDAGTTVEQRDAAIAAAGATVVDSIAVLRMSVVEVPIEEEFTALATLRANDVVTSADPDRPREAQAAPNDPGYAAQWALDRIGWSDVYGTLELQGTSRLAVLDTGVDANDPDLADRIVPGWSAFADETAWYDPNGHGTALASIAASVTNNETSIAGVAYGGVEIMPIRVLDAGGIGQDADIIEGLVWAVGNGADVALMGFSSTGYSAALQAAVDYAWSNGVVVVAAVGNDGDSVSHFPAAMAKVVGVSATDQQDQRWSGSNFGTSVFMAAPGVGIESVRGPVTGTSPAAAIVAGAAALLQAVDPAADPGVIVGRLARSADPVGTTDDVGNGILDLAGAAADGGTDPVVPVGGAPVGEGGPYVTYVAAAECAASGTIPGTLTATTTPASVLTGVAADVAFEFKTPTSNGSRCSYNSGSQFAVTIPTGWTSPQATDANANGAVSARRSSPTTCTTADLVTPVDAPLVKVSIVCPDAMSQTAWLDYKKVMPPAGPTEVVIRPMNPTAAAKSTWIVEFKSPTALTATSAIYFTVPGTVVLPNNGATVTLVRGFTAGCSAAYTRVVPQVTIQLSQPSATPCSLPANTKARLKIAGLDNPSSQQPATSFKLWTSNDIYTFAAQAKNSTSSLTPLAASPTIAVKAEPTAATDIFTPSALTLTPLSTSVNEGAVGSSSNVTFTVTRSGSGNAYTATADWALTGTAEQGTDYTAAAYSGTLEFGAGETEKTVTVTVQGDNVIESTNETVVLTLSDPVGVTGTPSATLTINSDDLTVTVQCAVAGCTPVAEGSTVGATKTLNLNLVTTGMGSATVTYDVESTGSAKGDVACGGDVDFVKADAATTAVTAPAATLVPITICQDAIYEGDETFRVRLSGVSSSGTATLVSPMSLTITITNDDHLPTLEITSVTQDEGDAGEETSFTFVVTKRGATAVQSTVRWYTDDDSATYASGDYTRVAPPGVLLRFPASLTTDTQEVTVQVHGDADREATERFFVRLSSELNATLVAPAGSSASPGTGIGTITNDDAGVTFTVGAVPGQAVSKTEAAMTFGVRITAVGTVPGTVAYAVSGSSGATGGTACTGDVDFLWPGPTSAAVSTPVMGSVSATETTSTLDLTVTVCADAVFEANEILTVSLSSPMKTDGPTGASAGLGTPSELQLTIVNDDAAPALTIADQVCQEGAAGPTLCTFTVTRTATAEFASAVTWSLVGAGTSLANADDFSATSGSFTFGSTWSTTTRFQISVVGDTAVEPGETFDLTLVAGDASSTCASNKGADCTARGTIVNDDTVLRISFDAAGLQQTAEANEPASGSTPITAKVTFVQGNAPIANMVLTYAGSAAIEGQTVANGGNGCGSTDDFYFNPKTASIALGSAVQQSLTIYVCGDTVAEADEILRVSLAVTGYHAVVESSASVTPYADLTIHDDQDKQITGRVVGDRDASGTWGGTDVGLGQTPVQIFRDLGTPGTFEPGTDTEILDAGKAWKTNASGNFTITGLASGSYWLTHTVPTGFEAVYASPGAPTGEIAVRSGYENNWLRVTLNGSVSAGTGHGFFDARRGSSISGRVVDDLNGDGVEGPDEPGLTSASVALYRDNPRAGDQGELDLEHDTLIGVATGEDDLPNGSFAFGSVESGLLLPGTYFLVETNPPAYGDTGYVLGTVTGGGVGTEVTRYRESDSQQKLVLINAATTTATAGDVRFLEAGRSASLSALVYDDPDADGAQGRDLAAFLDDEGAWPKGGATVTLYRDRADGTVAVLDIDDDTVATADSAMDGRFDAAELTPGTYFLEVALEDWVSTDTIPAANGTASRVAGRSDLLRIDLPANGTSEGNAFLIAQALSKVSGSVREDYDADGADDDGVGGVAGAVIHLFRETDGDGSFSETGDVLEASATTSSDGAFTLDDLRKGTYYVRITNPATWESTGALPIERRDAVDRLLVAVDGSVASESTGNVFLSTRATATIDVSILEDLLGNSAAGTGLDDDAPLIGARIGLYRDANGDDVAQDAERVGDVRDLTNASSTAFEGLRVGSYLVVEVSNPDGFRSRTALAGTGTDTTSTVLDDDRIRVVIAKPGTTSASNRFVDESLYRISGFVLDDADANGLADDGGLRVSGASVSLWLDDGSKPGELDGSDTLWVAPDLDSDGSPDEANPMPSAAVTGGFGFGLGGLANGTYFVEIVAPTDRTATGSIASSVTEGVPVAYRAIAVSETVIRVDLGPTRNSTGNRFLLTASDFTIGGLVVEDADVDLFWADDDPLAGITVTLYRGSGDPVVWSKVAEQTTDTDGVFSFGGRTAGSYRLVGSIPEGMAYAITNAIPTSGASSVDRTTLEMTLSADSPRAWTGNYFLAAPGASSISGRVLDDVDGDRLLGVGDLPLSATVTLWIQDQMGDLRAWGSTVSDESTGGFAFSGLPKGTFVLAESDPEGYVSFAALPSDRATAGTLAATVTGVPASISTENIFLDALAASRLSGTVYNDTNGDGQVTTTLDANLQPVTESGKDGVLVTAFRDDDGDGVKDATEPSWTTTTPSPTTVGAGSFLFTGLAKGTYRITTTLALWRQTGVNPVTATVGYDATTEDTRLFMQQANAEIQGLVFNDVDGDGKYSRNTDTVTNTSGIRVYVDGFDGVAADGVWQEGVEPSGVTVTGGVYSIRNLPAGTYNVQIRLPDGKATTNAPVTVTGLLAGATVQRIYIGMQAASTLTGYVFEDANRSGSLQASGPTPWWDQPMAEVEIRAYRDVSTVGLSDADINGTNARVWTAQTDADGFFRITGVPTGTYFLFEGSAVLSGTQYDGPADYPTGFISTNAVVCTSSCATNTSYAKVTANRVTITIDAKAYAAGATTTPTYFLDTRSDGVQLSGGVFNDVNADGLLLPDSPGVAGASVRVYKDLDGDGVIDLGDGDDTRETNEDLQMWSSVGSAAATTPASGAYSWSSLPEGTYLIEETDPSRYSSTGSIKGSGSNTTASELSAGLLKVIASANGTSTTNLFLDTPDDDVSVGGFVYDDLDADGTKDVRSGADQVLGGVKVRVYRDATNNGTFDYTDSNGNGRFDVGTETTSDILIHATRADNTRGEYATTAQDGSFSFRDLPRGTHFIVQTLPSGYSAVKTRPDPAETGGNITATPLASDKTVIRVATSGSTAPWGRSDLQFLDTRDDQITIRGFVYADADGNGAYGGSDSGLTGATVRIYKDANANGTFELGSDMLMSPTVNGGARASSMTTAAASASYGAGEWVFGGLPTGTYFVVETDPSGSYASTGATTVSSKATADPAAPKGRIVVVPDTDGESISGNFFLDARNDGSLFGVMVEDLNGNGVRDAQKGTNPKGDTPLNNGDIYIYKDDGDDVLETGDDTYVGTTKTGGMSAGAPLGQWSFSGLISGTYFIRQVPPTVTLPAPPGEDPEEIVYKPSGATFPTSGPDKCNVGGDAATGKLNICTNVDAGPATGLTPKRLKGEWLRVRLSPLAAPERMSWGSVDYPLSFLAQGADFEIAITDDSDLDGDGTADAVEGRYAGTPSATDEAGIYTVTVTNAGGGSAPGGALVTVTFPAGAKVALLTPNVLKQGNICVTTTTTWSCPTRSPLAAEASIDILLAIQVPPSYPAGNFVVAAEVYSAGDSNLGPDYDPVTGALLPGFNGPVTDTDAIARAAELSVTKTGDLTVVAGETLEYTITATNAGPSDAAVSLAETLPVDDLDGDGVDDAAYENVRYCVLVTPTACDDPALTSDAVPGDFTPLTGTTIPVGTVASESGTAWTWPLPGGYFSYASTDVIVRFEVKSGVNGSRTYGSTEYGNFRLTNRVDISSSAATDYEALSDVADLSDTWDTAVTTLADLSLAKTTAPSEVLVDAVPVVAAGAPIVYRIDIENLGPSDAQAVEVAEALPTLLDEEVLEGVEWCAYVLDPTKTDAENDATCTAFEDLAVGTPVGDPAVPGPRTIELDDLGALPGAIAAGDTVRILVRGTIPSDVEEDVELTNSATVSSETPEPSTPVGADDHADLSDSVTDTVVAVSDLEVDWDLVTDEPMIGEELEYAFIIRNLGPSDTGDITVTADVVGLQEIDLPDDCELNEAGDVMECEIADLPIDDPATASDDESELALTVSGVAGRADGVYDDTSETEDPDDAEVPDVWDLEADVAVASDYSDEPDDQVGDDETTVAITVEKRPIEVTLVSDFGGLPAPMYGKGIEMEATVVDAGPASGGGGDPVEGGAVDFLIACSNGSSQRVSASATDEDGETSATFTVTVTPDDECNLSAFHISGTSGWADGASAPSLTPIRVDKFELQLGYTGKLFVEVPATMTLAAAADFKIDPTAWVGWVPPKDLTDASASLMLSTSLILSPPKPTLAFDVQKVTVSSLGSLSYQNVYACADPKPNPGSEVVLDDETDWSWTHSCKDAWVPPTENATYEVTFDVPDADPYFTGEKQTVYVTVFRPSADMYASGGGFIHADPAKDKGLIAVSSEYDHVNFSFNVKYKKGSNTKTASPSGAFFLRFHGEVGNWDYRARSTSWSKGALVFTGLNSKASFQSMMTLTRIDPITGLSDPTFGGGNYTLRVDVTGDVLTKTRTIAFTIYTPKGSIIFYQAGTYIAQRLLGGGSIVVKSK